MIESGDNEDEIIEELEGRDLGKRRRRELLSKLQSISTERSIGVLETNLRAADVKSQVRAVLALTHVGTEGACDALAESLAVTTGPCFTFAVKALAENHAVRARPAFVQALEERGDELGQKDKQILVWALYRSPHRSEVPVLAEMLGTGNRSTRRMAAVALAQIRAPEAREALEGAARSLSWVQGSQARRALRLLRYVGGE